MIEPATAPRPTLANREAAHWRRQAAIAHASQILADHYIPTPVIRHDGTISPAPDPWDSPLGRQLLAWVEAVS